MFFSFACFVTLLLCLSQHRMSGAGIILARQATDVYIMFALALFRFFRCTFQTCSTFGSLIYMVYGTDIKFFRFSNCGVVCCLCFLLTYLCMFQVVISVPCTRVHFVPCLPQFY